MVHRDDREAMRARLEAMERQLADAREETELARAEAAKARLAAEAAERAAEQAAEPRPAPPSKKKEKKEKKKRRRARAAEAEAEAPVANGMRPAWTPREHWRFAISSGLLCLVAYGVPVPWFTNLPEDDDTIFLGFMMGSTVLVIAGHLVLAWLLRAPSGVGPPVGLSTILGGLPFIGLIVLAPADTYDFLPEGARAIGHTMGAGAAAVAGAIVVAAVITNVASEPSSR